MENKQFKVLWLDDDFVNENGSLDLPLPRIRGRYPQLDIETVPYIDWCEEIIVRRGNEYQVIILDVNGKSSKNPAMEPLKDDVVPLISKAQKTSATIYIYSGELSKERGESARLMRQMLELMGFVKDKNMVFKSGSFSDFLDRVIEELDEEFQVFYKYPEILDNVLHYGVNKECCKKLLLWLDDKENREFPHYDDLRRIVVDEAYDEKLKSFFGIDKLTNIKKDQITSYCMSSWEKDIILDIYRDVVNSNIHEWPSNNLLMREVLANSFLIALIWFNGFMHKIESNPNVTDYYKGSISTISDKTDGNKQITDTRVGIVEKDENGFYHVGPYILKQDWAQRYEGKRIRVTNEGNFYYRKIAYRSKYDNE